MAFSAGPAFNSSSTTCACETHMTKCPSCKIKRRIAKDSGSAPRLGHVNRQYCLIPNASPRLKHQLNLTRKWLRAYAAALRTLQTKEPEVECCECSHLQMPPSGCKEQWRTATRLKARCSGWLVDQAFGCAGRQQHAHAVQVAAPCRQRKRRAPARVQHIQLRASVYQQLQHFRMPLPAHKVDASDGEGLLQATLNKRMY